MAQINPVENSSNIWKKALTGGGNIIAGGSIEVSDITNKLDTLSDKGGLNVVKPTGKILIKQGFVDGADNIRGSELVYDLSASPFNASDWLITLEGQIKAGEPDLATVKRVLLLLTEDRELATGNFVCVYQKSDNKLYIVASDGTHTLSETVIYDTALSDDTTYMIAIGFNGEKFRCQVDGGAWTHVTKAVGYDPAGLRYAGWGFIPKTDANTLLQIDFRYEDCKDIVGNYDIEWCKQALNNNIKPGLIGAGLDNNNCGKILNISETGYSVIALIKPGTADENYFMVGNTDFAISGATINKWVCDIQTGAGAISGIAQILGNAGSHNNPTTSTENPTTSAVKPSIVMSGEMCLLIVRKNEISSAVQEQIEHALYSAAANLEIDRIIIK